MTIWNPFSRVQKRNNSPNTPSTSLSNPSSWLTALFAPRSKSGANTSLDNVISLPSVWRAVNLISDSLASVPFEVLEFGDDSVAVRKDHPISYLLAKEPSPLYTSYTFRKTLISLALLKGNAYALIVRDRRSQIPKEFRIFDTINGAMDVSVSDKMVPEYTHSSDPGKKYPYYDVVHIKNMTMDGVEGLSSLGIHRDNFGMGISARDFGNEFYANGAFLTGYLSVPSVLTPEAYARMKKSWNATYSGVGNAGRTAILEQGTEFKSSMVRPEDAQMIDVQKFSIQDVARIFGVPSHLLNDLDRATFSNIEQLSLEFAKYTLRPWAENIEQEFDRKVFKESEKRIMGSHLNLNGFLRGDTEAQANRYRTLIQNGIMSINEARKEERLNPVEGGDRHFIQLNMQDITSPVFYGMMVDQNVLQQIESQEEE